VDSSKGNLHLFRGADELSVVGVHDESGTYGVGRYFITGFLFVLGPHLPELLADLQAARDRHDYWGEIHYCKLTVMGDGPWGAKFRVARDWADILQAAMVSGGARAYVLAVDTTCATFDHRIFRGRSHHAYNRFTRIALETGVQWCFRRESALRLRLLSDAKSRRAGGDDEVPGAAGDNFVDYLPRIASRRIRREPRWPRVTFAPNRVKTVDPGEWHEGCEDDDCELVQAADLVVSSVAAAIRGPSGKPAKYEIARIAARWVRAGEYGHRGEGLDLWRRFGASVFLPGAPKAWLDVAPLAIELGKNKDQSSLFR
jgi:hypothetical protein